MSSHDKATETQLKNIQTKTGKSLTQLYSVLAMSKLAKHGELQDYAETELALEHGDANLVVTVYLKSLAQAATDDKVAGDADADPQHERR